MDWVALESLKLPPPIKPEPFDRKTLEEMASLFPGKRDLNRT